MPSSDVMTKVKLLNVCLLFVVVYIFVCSKNELGTSNFEGERDTEEAQQKRFMNMKENFDLMFLEHILF